VRKSSLASRQLKNRGEGDHRQSRRRWKVPRPGFAFLKERKLSAEEQVLGDEGRATNEQQSEDGEQP
jgi:hypothetical protein